MGNTWFQFKQFKIAQDRCAMKITTDACIQGAWTPLLPGVQRVLDIGAGTGLLSLMLAQRNPDIIIDAIEADPEAAAQASENTARSPWGNRVNIIPADVRDYESQYKYGLVISNPPFFTDSLLSPNNKKNTARHNLSLTYEGLIKAIGQNLDENGYASVLLPVAGYENMKTLMHENHWKEIMKLNIAHKPQAQVKRVISIWGKKEIRAIQEETLAIKGNENNYTYGFKDLLSPFYLEL